MEDGIQRTDRLALAATPFSVLSESDASGGRALIAEPLPPIFPRVGLPSSQTHTSPGHREMPLRLPYAWDICSQACTHAGYGVCEIIKPRMNTPGSITLRYDSADEAVRAAEKLTTDQGSRYAAFRLA